MVLLLNIPLNMCQMIQSQLNRLHHHRPLRLKQRKRHESSFSHPPYRNIYDSYCESTHPKNDMGWHSVGSSPNLPWRVILIGAGNNVDTGIIRCDNRVIFFKTDVADNNGTLVTTGTLLPTRTATPTNCDLTFLTVDGDFSITGSATGSFCR
jgi:hypothetical protein